MEDRNIIILFPSVLWGGVIEPINGTIVKLPDEVKDGKQFSVYEKSVGSEKIVFSFIKDDGFPEDDIFKT